MQFFIAPNSKNIITTLHVVTTEKSELTFLLMGPGGDSGSGMAKNVLDALENDTKANFQENIPDKVRFQKKWPWELLLYFHMLCKTSLPRQIFYKNFA